MGSDVIAIIYVDGDTYAIAVKGDIVTIDLILENSQPYSLTDVYVFYDLPSGLTLVPDSVKVNDEQYPDKVLTGGDYLPNVPGNGQVVVSFQALVNNSANVNETLESSAEFTFLHEGDFKDSAKTNIAYLKIDPSDEIVGETVDVVIQGAKNAVGAAAEDGQFTFGLYDEQCGLVTTAANDAEGLITFTVPFELGVYNYSVKEISGPQDGAWELDTTAYPVIITVTQAQNGDLVAAVSYPEGAPEFKNTLRSPTCGLVEFPELTFNAPGDYEYLLSEKTPSGDGWITDGKKYRVIVHVIEDEFGNLVATTEYPDGYPEFVDIYIGLPARITLSACKIGIGAPIKAGQFEFELQEGSCTGSVLSTATNLEAAETIPIGRAQVLKSARAYQRRLDSKTADRTPVQTSIADCRSIQRRLSEFEGIY
ncbi:hypothetical protein FACS1894184_16740 [Clostridia bacterium]|nr:hypothetical protein FACS1894184_16740 [Clostridia bacterium]